MHSSSIAPRAALFTYWNDGIDDYRRIIVGRGGDESYVWHVAHDLSKAMVPLIEHHADCVNCADLDNLHESWGEGDYTEDGWGLENVLRILKAAPEIAVAEYQRTGSADIQQTFWYVHLIQFLNDILPNGDGVWLNIEGPMGQFLSGLLLEETKSYPSIEKLSNSQAIWLGKLAVLAQLPWTENAPAEQWCVVHGVFDDFERGSHQLELDIARQLHVHSILGAMYDRLVRQAIDAIKALPDECRQSGEDSVLKDVWEEFKYQMQGEQSAFFEFYEQTIEQICAGLVAGLDRERQRFLWLGSDGFSDLWAAKDDVALGDFEVGHVAKELYERVCTVASDEELSVDPDEERARARYEEDMELYRLQGEPHEDCPESDAANGDSTGPK